MTTDKDEFYRDILDGLWRYRDDAFLGDVLETLTRHPEAELNFALNKNQMASKKWLIDALHGVAGGGFATVHLLGGWYATLGALLLDDARFDIGRLISVDIDARCAPIAECLNRRHVEAGRFEATTADILQWNGHAVPDLVINTSCEHIENFEDWFAALPAGGLVVLQSNDYVDCDEHMNCVADLDAFKRQAPLAALLYEGALPRKRYTRFMLIGRK